MERVDDEILFRLYHEGDEAEIIPLFKSVFDEWRDRGEKAHDYWRWFFEDNPSKGNLIIVVVSDGRIISANSSINLNIKICDQILPSMFGAFNVVHQNFRGKRISSRTRKLKLQILEEQGIRFNYYYTVHPIATSSGLRHQYIFPKNVARCIRVRDVDLHIKMKHTQKPLLSSVGYQALTTYEKIRKALSEAVEKIGEFTVAEVDRFDDRIDTFWKGISGNYGFIVERNSGYLNWRYCDPRAGDYTILQAEDNEQVIGYAVLGVAEKTPGYPEGYILDLLTFPDRLDASNMLIEESLRRFNSKNVNAVHCLTVKDHPFEGVLKRNGFIDSREELNIFWRAFGLEREMELVKNSPPRILHFSYGDFYSL